ncbi:MAG: hypothetical protein O2819_02760 [Planctomycetota bacterium]|nr:hypothetical protein [Planctomycetota bacterium]MDA1105059.1 hypothetical protein [Planctomycetota bacterium]
MTPAPASPAPATAAHWQYALGSLLCRIVVPAWVATGAIFKLVERNPLLLPQPIFDLVRMGDGTMGMKGLDWLDFALRGFIAVEFVLIAIMVFMPALARRTALLILGAFIVTLLALIIPLWAKEGVEKVLKGSCGCFGESGPNPIIMLGADTALFIAIVMFKPRHAAPSASVPASALAARGATLAAITGVALSVVAFAVPPKGDIALPAPPVDEGTAPLTPIDPGAGTDGSTEPVGPAPIPPVVPVQGAWPKPPASLAAFYLPEFAEWVGTRLDSHPEAALVSPAPPADFGKGVWNVVFYREDCDHCHELLGTYFTPTVRHPTLCIAIPDTDPAVAMEMPCEECQLRTMIKGPQYVLSTPVLLRLEDGVVTRVCGDPEDPSEVEACIE